MFKNPPFLMILATACFGGGGCASQSLTKDGESVKESLPKKMELAEIREASQPHDLPSQDSLESQSVSELKTDAAGTNTKSLTDKQEQKKDQTNLTTEGELKRKPKDKKNILRQDQISESISVDRPASQNEKFQEQNSSIPLDTKINQVKTVTEDVESREKIIRSQKLPRESNRTPSISTNFIKGEVEKGREKRKLESNPEAGEHGPGQVLAEEESPGKKIETPLAPDKGDNHNIRQEDPYPARAVNQPAENFSLSPSPSSRLKNKDVNSSDPASRGKSGKSVKKNPSTGLVVESQGLQKVFSDNQSEKAFPSSQAEIIIETWPSDLPAGSKVKSRIPKIQALGFDREKSLLPSENESANSSFRGYSPESRKRYGNLRNYFLTADQADFAEKNTESAKYGNLKEWASHGTDHNLSKLSNHTGPKPFNRAIDWIRKKGRIEEVE